jgi:hypothetical protein
MLGFFLIILVVAVEADVHHYHHGCYIQVNYRSPGPIMLKDVLISMPIPFHHQRSLDIDISKDKGKCIIEENQIVWHVPPIDMSNIRCDLLLFLGEMFEIVQFSVHFLATHSSVHWP